MTVYVNGYISAVLSADKSINWHNFNIGDTLYNENGVAIAVVFDIDYNRNIIKLTKLQE